MSKRYLGLLLCVVLASCRQEAPPAPVDTGSREVVATYFAAMAQQNWTEAHAQLAAETRASMDQASFERNARAYCKRIGFPLGKAFIRSCDEQGDKAIAQVMLTKADGSRHHRFHEGVLLRHEQGRWRIVLPANFKQM